MADKDYGVPGPECYDEDKTFSLEQLTAAYGRETMEAGARKLAQALDYDEDEAVARLFGKGTMSDADFLAGKKRSEKTEDKFLPRRR